MWHDAVCDGASVRIYLPRIAWALGRHSCERPVCTTVQRKGNVSKADKTRKERALMTHDPSSKNVAVMSSKPAPTPLVSYVLKLPETTNAFWSVCVESSVHCVNGWSTVP